VFAFSVLAWLGCKAFPHRVGGVLIGLLAYGGLIEILQSLTPDRLAEWNDWFADMVGLPIGWLASRFRVKLP
jgi:VanZ family protein